MMASGSSDYQPRHPDDVYWNNVMDELDSVDARPGPSSFNGEGQLIDISPSSSELPPIPPPRSRSSSASHPVRPRTLLHHNNISPNSSSPPQDDFVLVDVSPPGNKENGGRTSPEEKNVALLMRDVDGYAFNEHGKIVSVSLECGTLLHPLVKDGPVATFLERNRRHPSERMFTDLCNRNVALMERGFNVMWLTDEYVLLLLPLTPNERGILYRDFETFHFVANLKEGDYVSVFNESKTEMYQGRVSWRGERPRELGTWYEVEVNQANEPTHSMNVPDWGHPPPRNLYANAAHLHKPLKVFKDEFRSPPQPVHQPEVRNIPIRRVETCFDTDNSTHQQAYQGRDVTDDAFARDVAFWDGDPRTVNEPMREWKERPREDSRSERERRNHHNTSNGHHRNRHSQNGSQPSRSQSAHAVGVYDRTFSLDDPVKTNGARVGDRCVWNDGKMPHKGTIRFIGHLKGHTNLYAGVEFDDAVGKGTGTFQGEVVFQTAENRAGFVIFNTLEVLPRPPENGEKPPLTVKHKQASAESLSDPPAPPPVPPRPTVRPEDYLIDAVSIGSYVAVCHLGACRSGVVRWVGDQMSEDHDRIEKSAVVELDEDVPTGWRLAVSQPNSAPFVRGVLVPTSALRRDRRMENNGSSSNSHGSLRHNGRSQDFGSIDSGVQETPCEPWKVTEDLIGRMKGIQGHKNSCYIDATLYAMFAQSSVFDFLLERPAKKHDIPQYKELQKLLRTEIVYPLRKFHYVRADHVMKVRELFAEIMTNVAGLTSEEKDPEEILGQLFGKIFKAEPFLQLRNCRDNKIDHMFLCPLVVEDWQGGVATTQHLLERSMRAAQVKFAVAPEILILQLPRYGKQKLFETILPLERIDITGLVHNAVQPCVSCLKPAEGMCPECFLCKRVFLAEVSYCSMCYKKTHYHMGESDHVMREFYPNAKPVKKSSNHRMVLSAVLCIETSHYVAFVRSTTGRWLFFDSMADREGLSDGFNVPQVKECEKAQWWLSQAGWHCLRDADQNGSSKAMLASRSDVDPIVNRLLSDSYICFYQEEASPTPPSTNLLNNLVQRIQKF